MRKPSKMASLVLPSPLGSRYLKVAAELEPTTSKPSVVLRILLSPTIEKLCVDDGSSTI